MIILPRPNADLAGILQSLRRLGRVYPRGGTAKLQPLAAVIIEFSGRYRRTASTPQRCRSPARDTLLCGRLRRPLWQLFRARRARQGGILARGQYLVRELAASGD